MKIDLQKEQARLHDANLVRIGNEARWSRGPTSGRYYRAGVWGDWLLRDPWGRVLLRSMEGRFSSGPMPDEPDEDGNVPGGYPVRWASLAALMDPTFNPLTRQRDQRSLLYDKQIKITGSITDGGELASVMSDAGFHIAMRAKQRAMMGEGSVAVRPSITPAGDGSFWPVGLSIVHADECIAIPHPNRRNRCIAFAERMVGESRHGRIKEWWRVHDMRDPRNPLWGDFESVEKWLEGGPSIWDMSGRDYPFWWQGEPVMTVITQQEEPAAREPLPNTRPRLEGAIDLIMQRAWISLIFHAGSWNKALIMSADEVHGLRQLMLDPTVVNNLWGGGVGIGGEPKIDIVPESTGAAMNYWQMHRARYSEWAYDIDTGLEVRDSGDAKSGLALMLEMTGRYTYRQRLAADSHDVDRDIIIGMCAAHNGLVRRGQLRAPMILEDSDFSIQYPHQWNPAERMQRREEIEKAVKDGLMAAQDLWLFDREMENDGPTGDNWLLATASISESLAQKRRWGSQGYGVEWKDLYLAGPEPDTGMVPPDEVQRNAAKGLQLKSKHRRGMDGRTPEGRELLNRARSLANGEEMTPGQTKVLLAWLESAPQGDTDGEWGSMENPSTEWIEWLGQGGDAALVWLAGDDDGN